MESGSFSLRAIPTLSLTKPGEPICAGGGEAHHTLHHRIQSLKEPKNQEPHEPTRTARTKLSFVLSSLNTDPSSKSANHALVGVLALPDADQ